MEARCVTQVQAAGALIRHRQYDRDLQTVSGEVAFECPAELTGSTGHEQAAETLAFRQFLQIGTAFERETSQRADQSDRLTRRTSRGPCYHRPRNWRMITVYCGNRWSFPITRMPLYACQFSFLTFEMWCLMISFLFIRFG